MNSTHSARHLGSVDGHDFVVGKLDLGYRCECKFRMKGITVGRISSAVLLKSR